MFIARFVDRLDAHDSTILADEIRDSYALTYVRPVFPGIFQEHGIESAAHHLPGLCRLVLEVLKEAERGGGLAVGGHELNRVFLDEVRSLHLLDHSDPLEREVTIGQQRFADVVARKRFLLQQQDAVSVPSQQRRRRGTRRPAANHDRFVVLHPGFALCVLVCSGGRISTTSAIFFPPAAERQLQRP